MLEIEATLYISLDVHTEILFYWRLNKYISGGLENILFGISINTEQILLWTEKKAILSLCRLYDIVSIFHQHGSSVKI